MALMTKRERVLRTARFEETDRVPLYDIFQNDAIIERYGGRIPTPEDGLRTVALAIGRTLDMTRMVGAPQEPKEVVHDDGARVRIERWTSWTIERPFRDVQSLARWVETQISKEKDRTCTQADARRLFDRIETLWGWFAESDPTGRGDPAVLVIESGAGLTEMYHAAGMELFTELMFERPDLVEDWIETRLQAELRRVSQIARPDYIPIALTYDDIAHKTGPLFSPDWLRQYWIPRLKRLTDAWHERGVLCLFHSDGNLWTVLDDLIAAGIDGLNPLETLADMTVRKVRQAYPNLFLAGGIDVSQLLSNGTPDEVRAACRQAIADTQGRGYFMGSTTELHWEVRLENATAMFETAWESGVNPQG